MARSIDAEEFEELYGATAVDLLAYVRRRTSANAEDLVAEVYVVAWRRRSDLPAPELRRAWLFGVARTLLKADRRQHHRDREVLSELASRPETAAVTESARAVDVMTSALGRLAPQHREVLRLVAWEGLSPSELAVALGVRPGAARVRLHRARQALASDPAVRALVEESQAFRTS